MNFVRDHIKAVLEYTDTTKQIADIFTKGISKEKFLKHKCKLNVISEDADVEIG